MSDQTVDPRSIRWRKYFYCPVFFQQVNMQICAGRYATAVRGFAVIGGSEHPELGAMYEPCKTCVFRTIPLKRYIRPNIPARHPRLAEGDEVKLKKLIRKRRIRLFGE